jgi:hypothetical protein
MASTYARCCRRILKSDPLAFRGNPEGSIFRIR